MQLNAEFIAFGLPFPCAGGLHLSHCQSIWLPAGHLSATFMVVGPCICLKSGLDSTLHVGISQILKKQGDFIDVSSPMSFLQQMTELKSACGGGAYW